MRLVEFFLEQSVYLAPSFYGILHLFSSNLFNCMHVITFKSKKGVHIVIVFILGVIAFVGVPNCSLSIRDKKRGKYSKG